MSFHSWVNGLIKLAIWDNIIPWVNVWRFHYSPVEILIAIATEEVEQDNGLFSLHPLVVNINILSSMFDHM